MKKNILRLAAMMLLLAGSLASCKDKEESSNMPCPCEEGKSMQKIIPSYQRQTEAFLVRDSIPDNLFDQIDFDQIGISAYCIIYDSRTNVCGLYMTGHMMSDMWRIRNFPDFAKEWDIPENGCKVLFTGMQYEPCEHIPQQSFGWDDFYFTFDFILTSLKRKRI